MSLTANEENVLGAAWDLCFDGIADHKDLSLSTGLDIKSVRGVVTSLVNKGKLFIDDQGIDCQGAVFIGVISNPNDYYGYYGCDQYDTAEWDEMRNVELEG